VELGGTYPDVVQMLQQANESGALNSRFRVNALPETGREIMRGHSDDSDKALEDQPELASFDLGTPDPELFDEHD